MNATSPPRPRPLLSSLARVVAALQWLWRSDLDLRPGRSVWLAAALSAAGFLLWLIPQDVVRDFDTMAGAESVRVFYMVKDLAVAQADSSLAFWLVALAIGRALFNVLVGVLDLVLYRRVTGKPFDHASMLNISIVNAAMVFTGLFTLFNPALRELLDAYDRLIAHIPTVVELNGAVALLLAALIGDFCFYWSHRACHSVRLFWNLGHIYHHRNRNLTQLTCAIEPPSLLLQAAGGLSLLLLPLLSKLFTTDIAAAGWALLALMVFDTWTDPSHSPVMYALEARSRVLRSLRWVLVTVGVHFTHHSCEIEGKYGTGCNFGARLTIWDRLFGTYVEPGREIPRTGLFDPAADFCVNPLRYLLQPFARMGLELWRNAPCHWGHIVFGSTDYEPPVQIRFSR